MNQTFIESGNQQSKKLTGKFPKQFEHNFDKK